MSKRIALTGGGTGGHITPLLAVAEELKKQDPSCYVIYIGERNGRFKHLTDASAHIDESHEVFAGKLRRYHGESWLKRLLDIKTNILNIRDVSYIVLGTIQAVVVVKKLKPDMILLKGGFVGVPVGLAAAFWRTPFVTHDSDTVPGLANRLVSKWARFHATGMPAEYYQYPKQSIRYVGVLVSNNYQFVTEELQNTYRKQLSLPSQAKLLLITGGSTGAANINQAVSAIVDDLVSLNQDLHVIHQVGVGKGGLYDGFSHERVQVVELFNPMFEYTGAADVVVTRAGANTMAELGIQGKACIVVPNPLLTGGHQTKNAQVWKQHSAAEIIEEEVLKSDSKILLETINALLADKEKRRLLGNNLEQLTAKNASKKLATILLNPENNEIPS